MSYMDGWTYIKGPCTYVYSDLTSNASFKAHNPVTIGLGGLVEEVVASDQSFIYGIARNDAADSLGGVGAGKCLIEIPTSETVYAIKIGTSATRSELSIGMSFELEKSGNYVIGNEDSTTTPFVTIYPRDDFTTIDSADSTVWVQIIGNRIGPIGANAADSDSLA